MADARRSFVRVWLGLVLLLTLALVPVAVFSWLLNLLSLPWWLGVPIMMLFALTFAAWVMTSSWLADRIMALSRWSGMLPLL